MNQQELTKILRPGTGGLVERPRLQELIDDHQGLRITWITAPAGSGKTSLIASYSEQTGLSTVWYRFDGGDRDPSGFFDAFTRALCITFPDLSGELPGFSSDNLVEPEQFSASYFTELARRLPERLIIVLDDYHALDAASSVHPILKYLFTNAPFHWKFLVASRENPPADLLFLFVRRELRQIGWDQIRLDRNESLAILQRIHPAEMTGEDREQLLTLSDGWMAALIILSQWKSGYNLLKGLPQTGLDYLFQYIAGEVYHTLSEDAQRILLELSCFEEFDRFRVQELIGNDRATRFFQEIYRRNLFIEDYGTDDRIAYRFHHLVRDYLQTVACDFFETKELLELRRRVATILVETGEYEGAIRQYLSAGSTDDAYQLILKYGDHFLRTARYTTLESLLKQFPDEPFQNDPWFVCYLALAIQPFRQEESRLQFARAYDLFQERNDVPGMIEAWSRIFATMQYEWNIHLSMMPRVKWMNSNLHMLKEVNPDLKLAVYTALLLWEIRYESRAATLRELSICIMDEWPRASDLELRMASLLQLIVYVGCVHPHHIKFATLETMIHEVGIVSEHPMVEMTICYIRSVFNAGRNREMDEIHDIAGRGLAIYERSKTGKWNGMFLGLQIAISIFRNDRNRTIELMNGMEEIARTGNKQIRIFHYSLRNWAAMTFEIPEYSPLDDIYMCLELDAQIDNSQLTNAHFFQAAIAELRHGDSSRALSLAERGERVAQKSASRPYRYLSLLVNSRVLLEREAKGEAARKLSLALKYARRYGYSRTFWWWDLKMMSELMVFALRERIEIPTAIRIIRELKLEIVDEQYIPPEWPMPVTIRTLGEFQIEVDGKAFEFSPRKQQKQIALLQAIIALGVKSVSLESVADALWPDATGDTAMNNLEITIHRLRKLLGRPEFLIIRDRKISINRAICRVDLLDFLSLIARSDCTLETIVQLYRGPFLSSQTVEPWAVPMRENLKTKLKFFILDRGRKAEESLEPEEAISIYRTGLKAIPADEQIARSLIRIYQSQEKSLEILQLSEEIRFRKQLIRLHGREF